MLIKRSHVLATAAVTLMLAMAGCNGGGDDDNVAGGGNNNGQGSDSFFSSVLAIVNATAENTEPVEIDSIAVTSPDNTEPAATN